MRRIISHSQGFTLVELLVVVGIIALLIGLLMPTLNGARERANRVSCANNLRTIGQAIHIYADDNHGNYPRACQGPIPSLVAFNRPDTVNPFGNPRPLDNDVTAAMFLLVRNAGLSPTTFICPSSGCTPDDLDQQAPANRSNFKCPGHLSYSIAWPYTVDAVARIGYHWNSAIRGDFALAADYNPGTGADPEFNVYAETDRAKATNTKIRRMNSGNHQRNGQNVLFADGHVSFENTPFVGVDGDNIYTAAGATSEDPMKTPPTKPNDSVLLPTSFVQ